MTPLAVPHKKRPVPKSHRDYSEKFRFPTSTGGNPLLAYAPQLDRGGSPKKGLREQ